MALRTLTATVLLLLLAGCGSASSGEDPGFAETTAARDEVGRLPTTEPDMRGIVTEVQEVRSEADTEQGGHTSATSSEAVIGTILVEEDPGEEFGSPKDLVSVTGTTKIVRRRGEEWSAMTFGNIEAGQRAEVWYAGPVAESYPRQATANFVSIGD